MHGYTANETRQKEERTNQRRCSMLISCAHKWSKSFGWEQRRCAISVFEIAIIETPNARWEVVSVRWMFAEWANRRFLWQRMFCSLNVYTMYSQAFLDPFSSAAWNSLFLGQKIEPNTTRASAVLAKRSLPTNPLDRFADWTAWCPGSLYLRSVLLFRLTDKRTLLAARMSADGALLAPS